MWRETLSSFCWKKVNFHRFYNCLLQNCDCQGKLSTLHWHPALAYIIYIKTNLHVLSTSLCSQRNVQCKKAEKKVLQAVIGIHNISLSGIVFLPLPHIQWVVYMHHTVPYVWYVHSILKPSVYIGMTETMCSLCYVWQSLPWPAIYVDIYSATAI